MKKIYVHTSNLDYIKDLNENSCFEPVRDYNVVDFSKALLNELGRIKTPECNFHIIIGKLPQNGCPWCGSEAELIKLPNTFEVCPMEPQPPSKYCMECKNCGSRGPIFNVSSKIEIFEKGLDYFKNVVKDKYKERKMWDADLKLED